MIEFEQSKKLITQIQQKTALYMGGLPLKSILLSYFSTLGILTRCKDLFTSKMNVGGIGRYLEVNPPYIFCQLNC
jgi:hypothetical protein